MFFFLRFLKIFNLTIFRNYFIFSIIKNSLYSRLKDRILFTIRSSNDSIDPSLIEIPTRNQRFTRTIFVGSFSIRFFPPPKQIQSTKNVRDGGRNKSNRFPMNNSAFVSSNGCLETLFFFFVFRYSCSSLRDSVPDRVDLLESIESFSSTFLFRRPVGYVREPVTSTDYVYARLWLGYANVFPRKIASFVSHLRHADASICPTPSKSFHSDFLHPYSKYKIYIWVALS